MNIKILKTQIKKAEKAIISAHINPEGDSIGSQVALASLLKRLGKDAVILNEHPVPHSLQFMQGTENILKEMPKDFDFKAAFILDCPDLGRIGKVKEFIKEGTVLINIDHHISNQNFGKINWVDTGASSAGEIVFDIFKSMKMKIEINEAIAMYVAIMTDTGSFRYSNTTAKTHKIAAELIDLGVKPYDIYGKIYENTTLEDTNLLSEVLQTLKITSDKKIAWMWVTKEMLKKTKASLEGTEGIINFARAIEDVEVAILFRETGTEDRVKVSFRSKGNADVNELAMSFGGGGHTTASGCNVFGKKEEVEKKVLEKAREMILM